MYTVWDEKGNRNLQIEHGLSGLETKFSSIRNKKLLRRRSLDDIEKAFLCVFIAAMHARTKCQINHMADQWRRPLEMMDEMAKRMKDATEDEKRSMAKLSPPSRASDHGSLTHDQVRQIVDDPVGTMLIPMIQTESPLLAKLDMAILTTDTKPGFITSDAPCNWFDPQAYTRPPLYRAPALIYETIEITLPVSPTECIYLNRQGISGYQKLSADATKELNRRIRFHASEHYIVNQEFVDDAWFEEKKEPEDSWDKLHMKETDSTN